MCPGSVRIPVSGYVSVGGVLGEVASGVVNIFVPKPWGEEEMRGVPERATAALDSPDWPGRAEGERRIAARHEVRLETRVLMIAEGGGGEVLPLAGHARDISESGLALIVTAEDRRALAGFGGDYTLRLVLTLQNPQFPYRVVPF